jgi:hypothetical protein
MTMHVKFRQQHCNVLIPKKLTPWRDSNPGYSVLEAEAMTTMQRRHGLCNYVYVRSNFDFFFSGDLGNRPLHIANILHNGIATPQIHTDTCIHTYIQIHLCNIFFSFRILILFF